MNPLDMPKIRVLVVDDSALVRHLIRALINAQKDMETVGVANDSYQAREMIRSLNPDVLTLDIEMPGMNGLDFLARLMRLRPMPVVMVSTLTERGADVTLQALELGAVDFVAKPKLGIGQGLSEAGAEIAEKIRIAARARIVRSTPSAASQGRPAAPDVPAEPLPSAALRRLESVGPHIVAIGASTGGTEAIRAILSELPGQFPVVLIAQHMPGGFTRSFAARLDRLCKLTVKEAEHGELLRPGHAYVAPGGLHMRVARAREDYRVVLDASEPVNRHRPSVDVLFASVAQEAGGRAIGVMLTGMGRDGAQSMLAMRQAGAYNIAQDEASCVVYGMPREAVAVGAVHESLTPEAIAVRLIERAVGAVAVQPARAQDPP